MKISSIKRLAMATAPLVLVGAMLAPTAIASSTGHRDTSRTTITIGANHRSQQAEALSKLSSDNDVRGYIFNPTRAGQAMLSDWRPAGRPLTNPTNMPKTYVYDLNDPVGLTWAEAWNKGTEVPAGLANAIAQAEGLSPAAQHRVFTGLYPTLVAPHATVRGEHRAPIIRYTGNLTIVHSDYTETLYGVMFEGPNPNADVQGDFRVQ